MGDNKDDEGDPLGLIEIKSAAQWRAVSQRVKWSNSWKEEKCDQSTLFKPTSINELRLVCWRIKPWNEKRSGADARLFSTQFAVKWGVDCDEVVSNLFIGDKQAAGNIRFLHKLGITHVLNTAEGKEDGLVNLSPAHYIGSNIRYVGLPLWDTPACNIRAYLGCAAEFIGEAIGNGGKCLVNCQMGVSRSSSCAIAHLMINEGWTAKEALSRFRRRRDVRPNDGFLVQLVDLDNELRRQREVDGPAPLLSSLSDLERGVLPMPWHREFWTEPVTEEEIGYPLVPLGQTPVLFSPCTLSPLSSAVSSRRVSIKRASERRSESRRSSAAVSRNASLKKKASDERGNHIRGASGQRTPSKLRKLNDGTDHGREQTSIEEVDNYSGSNCQLSNQPMKDASGEVEEEDWGDDWEWEEEDEDEDEIETSTNEALTTTKKLELVCDIVGRPEDRWRYEWRRRSTDTRSISSSIPSRRSSTRHSANSLKEIQPCLENNDPLSVVKTCTAKQWRALTNLLDFRLDDVESVVDHHHKEAEVNTKWGREGHSGDWEGTPISFVPTTVRQLRLLFWKIKPWDQPQGSRRPGLFSSMMGERWGVDCDEVHPNLFVGDEESARNTAFLKHVGITHVLNSSEGKEKGCVDLNANYYDSEDIAYLGIPLWDDECANMLNYVGCANEFMKSALANGFKCLIFCELGVSCSGTFAIAHMMLSEGWTAHEAIREFRKYRDIRPNDHFLEQLVLLDNELKHSKQTGEPISLHLKTLDELEDLPRPWHFEYWSQPPPQLPFKLTHNKLKANHHDHHDGLQPKGVPAITHAPLTEEVTEDNWEKSESKTLCSVATNTSPERSWSPSPSGSPREEKELMVEKENRGLDIIERTFRSRSKSQLNVNNSSKFLSTSAPSKL